jgi:cytochrome c biogenesis factor
MKLAVEACCQHLQKNINVTCSDNMLLPAVIGRLAVCARVLLLLLLPVVAAQLPWSASLQGQNHKQHMQQQQQQQWCLMLLLPLLLLTFLLLPLAPLFDWKLQACLNAQRVEADCSTSSSQI